MAMNHALTVISWHENLPKEDLPPRQIWYSGEKVDNWFKDVEDKRSQNRPSGKSSSYDDADDVPMSTNELVESYRPK
jgi:hypothetical protein